MATTACIEIRRHYTPLGEKETDEVVGIVADMLVSFLKRGMPGGKPISSPTGTAHRSQQHSPGRYDAPGIAEGETHGSDH